MWAGRDFILYQIDNKIKCIDKYLGDVSGVF